MVHVPRIPRQRGFFSSLLEKDLSHLRSVLEKNRSVGVTIKPTKCHLGFHELNFLGNVSSARVRPDPEKTTGVASIPTKNF